MTDSLPSTAWLIAIPALWLTLRQIGRVARAYWVVRGSPVLRPSLFAPTSSIALFAPPWPRGAVGDFHADYAPYAKANSSVIAQVPVIDITYDPHIFVAEPDAVKIVSGDRFTFQKDVVQYKVIQMFGKNVVGTEGADWKRHRNISKPAFRGSTELVWRVTCEILRKWFEELDGKLDEARPRSEIELEVVKVITQITLRVFSAAGFGRSLSWSDNANPHTTETSEESNVVPEGHTMTFRGALDSALRLLSAKIIIPPLFATLRIPFLGGLKIQAEESFDELGKHIQSLISDARAEQGTGTAPKAPIGTGESDDEGARDIGSLEILKRLVGANQEAEGERLSDQELVSNVYVFLLAGHETSTHCIAFTLGLLALFPDVQEKLYQESMKVFPDGHWSKADTQSYKEDYPALEYTLAVLRESLRLFPLIAHLPKLVTSDTTLPATVNGQKTQVFVPKGSFVILDIKAVHHHPDYWGSDAHDFRPERFIDTPDYSWPRDAYLPFALGPRACMGVRFAQTEIVCILAHLVRRYRLTPSEDIMSLPTPQARYDRMMRWRRGITSTPTDIRVRLSRR